MKRNDRKLVQEALQASMISEGLIDSLVSLFIAPKLKRDVNKLKNSPEWKEWMQKLDSTRKEMEMYSDRLESRLKWYDELEKYPEKYGYSPSQIKAMRNASITTGKYTNHALGRK